MATEQEIVRILRYMAAAWPRAEMTPETVAIFVMHMLRTQLPVDVLLLAAINLVDNMEFFPSVAEWRNEATRIQDGRTWWQVTANYRLDGECLPDELMCPVDLGAHILGCAPALLEAGQ